MHKRLTLSLLLVLLSVAVAGCSLFDRGPRVSQVHGVVEDFQSGDPMEGVIVDLDDRQVTTGADGKFAFADVQHGNYTLTILDGDDEIHSQTVIVSGDVTEVTVRVGSTRNLVENSGFEVIDPETNFAKGWEERQYDADIEFAMDSEVVRSGNYSARVTGTHPSPGANKPRGTPRRFAEFEVPTSGEAFRFGGWFKAVGVEDVKAIQIRYTFRNQPGSAGDIPLSGAEGFEIVSPGSDRYKIEKHLLTIYPEKLSSDHWELIEAVIVPPNGAIRVLVEPLLWHSEGTVWWDDIFVEPIE